MQDGELFIDITALAASPLVMILYIISFFTAPFDRKKERLQHKAVINSYRWEHRAQIERAHKEQETAQKQYNEAVRIVSRMSLPPIQVPPYSNLQQRKKLRARLEREQFEQAVQNNLVNVKKNWRFNEALNDGLTNFIEGRYPICIDLDEEVAHLRQKRSAAAGFSTPSTSN